VSGVLDLSPQCLDFEVRINYARESCLNGSTPKAPLLRIIAPLHRRNMSSRDKKDSIHKKQKLAILRVIGKRI
jgi:hypothetical protein